MHLAITLAIFNFLSKTAGNLGGLNGVITFYSVIVILLGILVFFLMKDNTTAANGEKFNFKQVITVIKNFVRAQLQYREGLLTGQARRQTGK